MSSMPSVDRPARRRSRQRLGIVALTVIVAVAGSVILATSGADPTATTRGLTATLHLPARPTFALADQDALWVSTFGPHATPTSTSRGSLLRVDLATGAVPRTVPLNGEASNLARVGNRLIATVDTAGVYANPFRQPGYLLAVDWATGRILVRRPVAIPPGPLAVGNGVLWAAAVKPAALEEFDERTLAPIAAPLPLTKTRVYGLTWGDGYVWASASDDGDVLRINPTTRAVTRVHIGGFPIGIAVAGGSVWVIDNARDKLVRVNPTTLRQLGRPAPTGKGADYLATDDGYVFVSNTADGTVSRYDERTGAMAGAPVRIAPARDISEFGASYAVAPAGPAVWATSPATATVSRIRTHP
jgi:streptogramin lyase